MPKKPAPKKPKTNKAAQLGPPIREEHLTRRNLSYRERIMIRKAAAEQLCIDSLYEFLQVAWQYVEPGVALHLNSHLEIIARELEVVYPGVRSEEPPFGWELFVQGTPPRLGSSSRPEGLHPGDILQVVSTLQEAEEAVTFLNALNAQELGLHPDPQHEGPHIALRPAGGVIRIEENWRAWVPERLRPSPLWRNSRLIINIPPGHMKSLMVSVFWPAWIAIHDPGHRTLSISGSDAVAIRDSMRTRAILDTKWFTKLIQRHSLNLQRTWQEIEEVLDARAAAPTDYAGRVARIPGMVRRHVLGPYAMANRQVDVPPWTISKKKDAKASFGTTLGGYRESKALGGRITGERGYGWTLDDPIDVKEVLTHGQVDHQRVAERCGQVVDTIDKVLDSRVNDMRPGYFYNVIIMQRLHVNDPPGTFYRRMKEGGDFWRFVVMRSEHVPDEELEADEPPNHPDDIRTPTGAARAAGHVPGTPEWEDFVASFEEKAGALLFELRFPRPVIEGIKRRLGDQYPAQHGQSPLPGKGGFMSEALERCHRYMEDPFRVAAGTARLKTQEGLDVGRMELMMTVDATFGAKGATASNVAIQIWGRPYAAHARGRMYLLDCVAAKMDYTETEEAVKAMKLRWPRVRRILIEKKANGAALLNRLASRVPGLEEYDPEGSKQVRAGVLSSCMKTGSTYLPAGDPRKRDALTNGYTPWIDELVTEFVRFPGGARDDRVDAASSAVIYWTEKEPAEPPEVYNDKLRGAFRQVAGSVQVGKGPGAAIFRLG